MPLCVAVGSSKRTFGAFIRRGREPSWTARRSNPSEVLRSVLSTALPSVEQSGTLGLPGRGFLHIGGPRWPVRPREWENGLRGRSRVEAGVCRPLWGGRFFNDNTLPTRSKLHVEGAGVLNCIGTKPPVADPYPLRRGMICPLVSGGSNVERIVSTLWRTVQWLHPLNRFEPTRSGRP